MSMIISVLLVSDTISFYGIFYFGFSIFAVINQIRLYLASIVAAFSVIGRIRFSR